MEKLKYSVYMSAKYLISLAGVPLKETLPLGIGNRSQKSSVNGLAQRTTGPKRDPIVLMLKRSGDHLKHTPKLRSDQVLKNRRIVYECIQLTRGQGLKTLRKT